MPKFIDRTGQRFGLLVVISQASRSSQNKIRWNCKCDCGSATIAISNDLASHSHTSCGCVKDAKTRQRQLDRKTHRLSRTGVGRSWSNMLFRCYNPACKWFHNYGGRGIFVCNFLKATPENLLSILGHRERGLSIDRIKNNGHYSCGGCKECKSNSWPLNVRWATPVQQMRNVRYNHLVTINGVTKCLAEWDELLGFPTGMTKQRLKLGWSGQDLLAPRNTKFLRIGHP